MKTTAFCSNRSDVSIVEHRPNNRNHAYNYIEILVFIYIMFTILFSASHSHRKQIHMHKIYLYCRAEMGYIAWMCILAARTSAYSSVE